MIHFFILIEEPMEYLIQNYIYFRIHQLRSHFVFFGFRAEFILDRSSVRHQRDFIHSFDSLSLVVCHAMVFVSISLPEGDSDRDDVTGKPLVGGILRWVDSSRCL
jgi:hypothetical protein